MAAGATLRETVKEECFSISHRCPRNLGVLHEFKRDLVTDRFVIPRVLSTKPYNELHRSLAGEPNLPNTGCVNDGEDSE
jgi:hypothetical protein